MKLSRQVFFVSLLTLSLPWAGFQYVRQLDAQLLQTQEDALANRAQSVALQLLAESEGFAELLPPPQMGGIHFPNLETRPALDGDCSGWLADVADYSQSSGSQSLAADEEVVAIKWKPLKANSDDEAQYLAGRLGSDLYICLQVEDPELQYSQADILQISQVDSPLLAFGDFVLLETQGQRYWLKPNSAGPLQGLYLDGQGVEQKNYTLNAYWQEVAGGYQLELRIPDFLAEGVLAIEVIDNGWNTLATLGLDLNGSPLRYIQQQNDIQAILASLVLRGQGNSAFVLANGGALVAAVGDQGIYSGNDPQDWLAWVYRMVSDQEMTSDIYYEDENGFFSTEVLAQRLTQSPVVSDSSTKSTILWFSDGNGRIARSFTPLAIGGLRVGTLVLDEPASTLSDINREALTQLIWYSGSAFALTSLGLIAYALWLSARIRRLSNATSALVSSSQVNNNKNDLDDQFEPSKAKDELGELSRQYGAMLDRVASYTDYLQSLSGKLSHEIRTPLAIVRSSLDNLEQAEDSETRETYLNRAGEGIDRLSSILSAMSESTAIESAIESADRGTFIPAEVLVDLTRAYADLHSHISFELQITELGSKAQVIGSPDLFAQMLDKLVDNAVDFCTGSIHLSLNLDPSWVELRVANEGPCLPAGMAQSLFDSLVSVRQEPSEKPHLGLGLFVVKRVVDFHAGEIQAQNLPQDQGVEFVVRLPLSLS